MRPLAPPHLLAALDKALEDGTRMSAADVELVHAWLVNLIATNVNTVVNLSLDELCLVAHALGDAIGWKSHEIPELPRFEEQRRYDTIHVPLAWVRICVHCNHRHEYHDDSDDIDTCPKCGAEANPISVRKDAQ